MQRTTTTATLLVSVTMAAAVTAVAGCVTVQRPPAPGPAALEARHSAARPDGARRSPPVEAPARESLELTDPSSKPKPGGPHGAGAAEEREETVRPEGRDGIDGSDGFDESDGPDGSGRPDGPEEPGSRRDPARGPAPSAAPPRRPPADASPKDRSRPARPPRPTPALPAAPSATPGRRGAGTEVCALGRTYGRWRPDSPEAAICRQAYGR